MDRPAAAFQAVAREWFIPDRIWVDQDGFGVDHVALDRAADPARWLAAVHSDTTIVTQFDDGAALWPEQGQRPTSSSSQPSVVAAMLRVLDVEPGCSVLEIGTGTGYNAALLAELVGPTGHVTTVEVDPAVATRARHSLAAAGYTHNVRVMTADGAGNLDLDDTQGWDRVIATAGVRIGRLPYGWVRHTRPGGIILAPMRADLAVGPLVRFVVAGDGTAHGRAVSRPKARFMEMRTHRVPAAARDEVPPEDESADESVEVTFTDRRPWGVLLDADCRWAVAVAVPSCRHRMWEGRRRRILLQDPLTGSWASVVPSGDGFQVRQFGPRRLWDEAEAARRWWQQHGEPPVEAWEWTVTPERQTVTLPAGPGPDRARHTGSPGPDQPTGR